MDKDEQERLYNILRQAESGAYTQIGDRLDALSDQELVMLVGAIAAVLVERKLSTTDSLPEDLWHIGVGALAGIEAAEDPS